MLQPYELMMQAIKESSGAEQVDQEFEEGYKPKSAGTCICLKFCMRATGADNLGDYEQCTVEGGDRSAPIPDRTVPLRSLCWDDGASRALCLQLLTEYADTRNDHSLHHHPANASPVQLTAHRQSATQVTVAQAILLKGAVLQKKAEFRQRGGVKGGPSVESTNCK